MSNENNDMAQSLTIVDKLTVDLAKSQRQLALANAKAALSEQEKVEAQYRMLVQNLFSKYSLSENDRINEDGTIVYGGAEDNGDAQ